MVRVAPINLAYNPRTLWFDPCGIEFSKGDAVVVETARGVEFGHAASDAIEVDDSEIKALKSPLKPVLRLASDEDVARAQEMELKSREALPVFKRMVAESDVEMHPVSVEYLLEGDKAVFYFEAEERVDFRDLVRKLAAQFHVRIDMRQIGVRDEARIVGGLGHCGQELCCKRLGGDFNPVSIRMAKEQDLSLNPQKISGLCGRLMCCLRYEYDAYKDFKSRAPKQGATIQTPQGPAKVVDLDVPREVVSVRLEDEKPVRVPLSYFDEPQEGARPSVIGEDAWTEACASAQTGYKGDPVTFLTSQFTGSDKLAEAGSLRRTPGGKSRGGAKAGAADQASPKKRRNRSDKQNAQETASATSSHRARRRRTTRISGDTAVVEDARKTSTSAAEESSSETKMQPPSRRSRHRAHAVGGKSSESTDVAQRRGDASKKRSRSAAKDAQARQASDGASQQKGSSRKHGQRKKAASGGSSAQPKQTGETKQQGQRKSGPRPGQRSSGLAHCDEGRSGTQQASGSAQSAGAGSSRRRRRNRKPRSEAAGSRPDGGQGSNNA